MGHVRPNLDAQGAGFPGQTMHGSGERREFGVFDGWPGLDEHDVDHPWVTLASITQRTINIAPGLPFGLRIALVIELLTSRDSDIQFGQALLEVQP